jgi:hypothetical protein
VTGGVDAPAGHAGHADEQRDAHDLLVQANVVARDPVFVQAFAVVRRDDQDRPPPQPLLRQGVDEPTDRLAAQARLRHVSAELGALRRRGVVGVMGIHQVHEEEHAPAVVRRDASGRGVHHLRRQRVVLSRGGRDELGLLEAPGDAEGGQQALEAREGDGLHPVGREQLGEAR